jgi:hypothetical protein
MTRVHTRVVLAIVVVATALVLPLIARARHIDVTDQNDVRGLLDVRLVKTFGEERPGFRVFTFNPWSNREIFERGFILVFFDTLGTKRSDYYVLAKSTSTRMVASLYRDRQYKQDRRVASASVWRPSRRSVTIQIPLGRMKFGSNRLVYRWYVETLFTNRRCPRVCFDFAPNNDVVVEPRPGAAATTTSSGS